MSKFLETTVDKFTFKVAADRLYTSDHLWVRWEEGLVRLGLSDYLQQTSGDVAFAEVRPEGTVLARGDELGSIETMKVNLSLPSPVSGAVKAVNDRLEDGPELVNQDPYGEGWLALIEPANWNVDKSILLSAQTYFEQMRLEAEAEAKNL